MTKFQPIALKSISNILLRQQFLGSVLLHFLNWKDLLLRLTVFFSFVSTRRKGWFASGSPLVMPPTTRDLSPFVSISKLNSDVRCCENHSLTKKLTSKECQPVVLSCFEWKRSLVITSLASFPLKRLQMTNLYIACLFSPLDLVASLMKTHNVADLISRPRCFELTLNM